MCICINCLYVHECSAYAQVKRQHSKLNLVLNKEFDAAEPIIYVNINNLSDSTSIDWDIVECLSFLEKPGSWIV
uniref:Ycf34 n=1 Tax=Nemalion sp. H.1444 TaxID=1907586 RepID=A0A1G4NW68_9FLOR|nr:Hypothetical protein ycf34 [Nemalion sp. H.1444]